MIEEFNYRGVFVNDTTIPGEQRKDRISPSRPFCARLSRDRWMLVFGTRGFTGVDDDRCIVYQIRSGSPDGPVLTESLLAKSFSGWDPLDRGDAFFKAHGHPTVFGVPKGALNGGRPFPNNNIFVGGWYTYGKIEKDGRHTLDGEVTKQTLHIEWVQFRLNDTEDDIEIIAPATELRQKGYESGEAFSSLGPDVKTMNHWITGLIPANEQCTQWIECAHFDGKIAAVCYEFNSDTGSYEWTRTGPYMENHERQLSEASINKVGNEWIVCVRTSGQRGQTCWLKTHDPFSTLGEPTYVVVPTTYGPRTTYLCPDGILRIFSGDINISPYGLKRNPLYCWDVNTDDFSVSNQRVVLDARKAGLELRTPMIGFAELFPHQGSRQLVSYRVMVPNKTYDSDEFPAVTEKELSLCGSYLSEIVYDETVPEPWEFQEG